MSGRGGRRAGAGRPREDAARREILRVRVAAEDLERWRAALELADAASLSEIARELLDLWAERLLTDT